MKGKVLHYSWGYLVRPSLSTRALLDDPERTRLGFLVTLNFAILYSLTAMLLHLAEQEPVMEPVLPIDRKRYYFWQAFFTVPWGMAVWLMSAGALQLLNRRQGKRMDDILGPAAFANVLPWLFLTWVPETFIVPVYRRVPWPAWVDAARIILASVWAFLLYIKVTRITYGVSWASAAVTSLAALAVMGVMYTLFIR
jgi:hypothetical protein